MKKVLYILLVVGLSISLIGCNKQSIFSKTEEAKRALDFEYIVPSYLPNGYKLVSETFTPPRRTEYDDGEHIVRGRVVLEFMKRPGNYIEFIVRPILSEPIKTGNLKIEVLGKAVFISKDDYKVYYEWSIDELKYFLETDKKFPSKEAEKIIESTLNQ